MESKAEKLDINMTCAISNYVGLPRIKLNVDPETTIEDLKRSYCDAIVIYDTGLTPDMIRVIYMGKQLENGRSLKDYGVEDGSSIYICGRLRGD